MREALKQSDPRWSSHEIDHSGLTLGSDGCTITAFTVFLRNMQGADGKPIILTPDQVELALRAGGAIQDGTGFIIWTNIPKAFPTIAWLNRDYVMKPGFDTSLITSQVALAKAQASIRCGLYPLVNVFYGNVKKTLHWVLGVPGGEFLIMDPGFGDIVEYRNRYGDPSLTILGLARFYGRAISAPDETMKALAFKAWEMKNAELPAEQYKIDTYRKEIFNDIVNL